MQHVSPSDVISWSESITTAAHCAGSRVDYFNTVLAGRLRTDFSACQSSVERGRWLQFVLSA